MSNGQTNALEFAQAGTPLSDALVHAGDRLLELAASAIPSDTIRAAGIRSVSDGEARDFGFRGLGSLSGLFFPYWRPETGAFSDRYGRLKPDAKVDRRKYLSPIGESPRFYFTPGSTPAQLANIALPIIIVEGEKKALAVAAWAHRTGRRYLVIGIGGCDAWKRSVRGLLPDGSIGNVGSEPIQDFDLIDWRGRSVTIALDGDVTTNWRVRAAETALVKELARRGV